jgi:hypothetical protein
MSDYLAAGKRTDHGKSPNRCGTGFAFGASELRAWRSHAVEEMAACYGVLGRTGWRGWQRLQRTAGGHGWRRGKQRYIQRLRGEPSNRNSRERLRRWLPGPSSGLSSARPQRGRQAGRERGCPLRKRAVLPQHLPIICEPPASRDCVHSRSLPEHRQLLRSSLRESTERSLGIRQDWDAPIRSRRGRQSRETDRVTHQPKPKASQSLEARARPMIQVTT